MASLSLAWMATTKIRCVLKFFEGGHADWTAPACFTAFGRLHSCECGAPCLLSALREAWVDRDATFAHCWWPQPGGQSSRCGRIHARLPRHTPTVPFLCRVLYNGDRSTLNVMVEEDTKFTDVPQMGHGLSHTDLFTPSLKDGGQASLDGIKPMRLQQIRTRE